MRLICLGCAWVAGIYLSSRISLPLCLFPLALSLPVFFLRRDRQTLLWTLLCLLAFTGGIFRFQQTAPIIDQNALQFYNHQGVVEIRGVVEGDPEPLSRCTRLRLGAKEIKADGGWRGVLGTALVYAPKFPTLNQLRDFPYYRYGDLLLIRGELEGRPEEDELTDSSYWDYLARQGIYSIAYYPKKVELIDEGRGIKPLEWFYALRNRLSQSLASALPEPQGSLAQGLLLGIRTNIPKSLLEDFSGAGVRHIIAISGLHISIMAGIFLSVGVWLFGRRRSIYLLLPLCGVWVYTLLSGARPSALRAAIMASLFLYAMYLGRQRSASTALVFAAAVMVGVHPQILWQLSFQLSFLAMAGLILLAPPLQNLGRRGVAVVGERGRAIATVITDSFAITLGAVLATLPLIGYHFHLVSVVAPPATFLALPALPGIIVTAFLVALTGLFAPAVAWVLGWVAWLFLSYMMVVVKGFAALPFSSFQVSSMNAWIVWVCYGVLALALWANASRKKLGTVVSQVWHTLRQAGAALPTRVAQGSLGKWLLVFLLVVAALVWAFVLTMPSQELQVSVLDVGQGDAILIQKGTEQVLVDGGPDPQKICLELGKKMPFWDRSIELVVLTHPQDDHITGLVEVLRRYKVGQVLEPGFEYDIPAYEEWLKLIDEKGIKRTTAHAGQYIELGDEIEVKVLHPQEESLEGTNSDVNNSSVVLRLAEGDVSFLLTGDIEEEAERELLHRHARELDSTVLKVAHHGSDTSSCLEFLDAVGPQAAVISVGADNRFGHPRDEVIERLRDKVGSENVYRTDEQGTITFITDGEMLWVETER